MGAKRRKKPDDPQQSVQFVETARALETNDSSVEFSNIFDVIVKPTKKPSKIPVENNLVEIESDDHAKCYRGF